MHACSQSPRHTHKHRHRCMPKHIMYTHTLVRMCTHTHTHTHARTHAHTHTHSLTHSLTHSHSHTLTQQTRTFFFFVWLAENSTTINLLCLSCKTSLTENARAHTHTPARTHTDTHTHIHTQSKQAPVRYCILFCSSRAILW